MHLHIIQNKIVELRGSKVMLDFDLAELYEVETRVLNQAVKRNFNRFPLDFMFQLTESEWNDYKLFQNNSSQIVMSSTKHRGFKYLPYAFTEQGVAMLSSVLGSKKAIEVNINVIRAFVFLRNLVLTHNELSHQLKELEQKYDKKFTDIYQALNYLIQKDKEAISIKARKKIGYK